MLQLSSLAHCTASAAILAVVTQLQCGACPAGTDYDYALRRSLALAQVRALSGSLAQNAVAQQVGVKVRRNCNACDVVVGELEDLASSTAELAMGNAVRQQQGHLNDNPRRRGSAMTTTEVEELRKCALETAQLASDTVLQTLGASSLMDPVEETALAVDATAEVHDPALGDNNALFSLQSLRDTVERATDACIGSALRTIDVSYARIAEGNDHVAAAIESANALRETSQEIAANCMRDALARAGDAVNMAERVSKTAADNALRRFGSPPETSVLSTELTAGEKMLSRSAPSSPTARGRRLDENFQVSLPLPRYLWSAPASDAGALLKESYKERFTRLEQTRQKLVFVTGAADVDDRRAVSAGPNAAEEYAVAQKAAVSDISASAVATEWSGMFAPSTRDTDPSRIPGVESPNKRLERLRAAAETSSGTLGHAAGSNAFAKHLMEVGDAGGLYRSSISTAPAGQIAETAAERLKKLKQKVRSPQSLDHMAIRKNIFQRVLQKRNAATAPLEIMKLRMRPPWSASVFLETEPQRLLRVAEEQERGGRRDLPSIARRSAEGQEEGRESSPFAEHLISVGGGPPKESGSTPPLTDGGQEKQPDAFLAFLLEKEAAAAAAEAPTEVPSSAEQQGQGARRQTRVFDKLVSCLDDADEEQEIIVDSTKTTRSGITGQNISTKVDVRPIWEQIESPRLLGVELCSQVVAKAERHIDRSEDDLIKMLETLTRIHRNDFTLLQCRLVHEGVDDYWASHLAEVLGKNTFLQQLFLNGNLITDASVNALALALKENRALQTLSLGGNDMTCYAAQSLASALEENSVLRELNLAASVKSHKWSESDADDAHIKGPGAGALAMVLKENNSTLTSLTLAHQRVWDAGAISFASVLRKNVALCMLDLRDNTVGDAGAQALATALETNATLKTLNLSENRLQDNGAQRLAEALEKNSTLTCLDLMRNRIGELGGERLAQALNQVNTTVTVMPLIYNMIPERLVREVNACLERNSRFVRQPPKPTTASCPIRSQISRQQDSASRLLFLRQVDPNDPPGTPPVSIITIANRKKRELEVRKQRNSRPDNVKRKKVLLSKKRVGRKGGASVAGKYLAPKKNALGEKTSSMRIPPENWDAEWTHQQHHKYPRGIQNAGVKVVRKSQQGRRSYDRRSRRFSQQRKSRSKAAASLHKAVSAVSAARAFSSKADLSWIEASKKSIDRKSSLGLLPKIQDRRESSERLTTKFRSSLDEKIKFATATRRPSLKGGKP